MDRMLVIGPSWVGDMVMAQPLLRLLKEQMSPAGRIDMCAPDWALPLTNRMPEVNQSIVAPFAHGKLALAQRIRLARALKASAYDAAIVLPNSIKSALVPWIARIPTRIGYIGEQRYGLLTDIRRLDKTRHPRTVDRFCALGVPTDQTLPNLLPVPKLIVDQQTALATRELFALPSIGNVLGLCPGAEFGPSKCWPLEHYAALAVTYLKRGWNVWIFGSPKDAASAATITYLIEQSIDAKDRVANLCGLTNLGQAIDLLSLTNVVVSNDSGLMHIAAAVDAPLVALYGSTTPAMTPPLSRQSEVIQRNLECRPCFKRECPLGHHDCLNLIKSGQVSEAIDGLTTHR